MLCLKDVLGMLFICSMIFFKETCCGPFNAKENDLKNNPFFNIPWFDVDFRKDLDPVTSNKKERFQFLGDIKRDPKTYEDFGSDEKSDSDEDYGGNEDLTFDYGRRPQYNHQRHYGFNNFNPDFYGSKFGHSIGHHRGFSHHHHNLDFGHHDHTPDCIFPFGDHGRRHPRPGPPPPRGSPPPPTGSPTIAPTTTNPPTAAPSTTTMVIDPRASTIAGMVSTEVPAIDIRFNSRDVRSIRN